MFGLPPLILQLVLQALDVLLHVATDQLEPVRVASNLILGLAVFIAARPGRFARSLILVASGAYLALNILFLVQYGLANSNTGGLRIPLFGFVVGSLVLAGWQWCRVGGAKTG